MVFGKQKRFMAGAICPHCKQVDTIVVFSDERGDKRACVACNVEEMMSVTDGHSAVQIISTSTLPK